MAFITLRRSRNTSSYYLVESYRDEQGRSRKRTLCYLGREQDGTDTLAKALDHWQASEEAARRDLKSARGGRRRIVQDRIRKAEERLVLLRQYAGHAARQAEQERRAEEEARRRAEEAEHWQAIERLHRNPSDEHTQAAKRAFRILALRLHPDQGGSHEAFIRLKTAYDRATDALRRRAG
jgi:hypothetical protein